jgi:selenocysteine lyase/cysteine desulfurase
VDVGYSLEDVCSQLPIPQDWTYLNTGTVGIIPDSVLERHLDNIADHERGGHATQERAVNDYERARTAIARLVSAAPSEIALNRNATDGVNFVAASLPLNSGDEVLTSTEEHPAIVLPWSAACERSGATLRFFELSHIPEILASNVRADLSNRTRIVAISHVSCETGAHSSRSRSRVRARRR